MDFSALLTDLRDVAEKYKGKTTEPQVSTHAYADMFTKILRRAQKDTEEYDDQITVLWVALNQLAAIYKDLSPGAARDQLCKFIFGMCAKTVLNIQWAQLDEDSKVKKNFSTTVEDVHKILSQVGFHRFQLILNLMESHWTHPILSKIMSGDDEDTEDCLDYIQKEDPEVLKLRIEIMIKENCEEFALNLCNWSLKHPALHNDLKIKEHQIYILYKQQEYGKMQEVCETIICHDGIKVMSHLAKSQSNQELCIRLAQVFLIQDWINPDRNCCTQELLKLWIHHQYLADKDEERFLESIWTVAKVCRDTEQIGVLIDGVKKECGDMFIQLYSELCKFAINIDKGNIEKEQAAGNKPEVDKRKLAMSKTCVRMAFMLKEYDFRISRICGLTAFSLDPTTDNLNLVNKLYWTMKNVSAASLNSKINIATLYEIERLLGQIRPEMLDPEFSWKQLIPLCKKYKQDCENEAKGIKKESNTQFSATPTMNVVHKGVPRNQTRPVPSVSHVTSSDKYHTKQIDTGQLMRKGKQKIETSDVPRDIQRAHLAKLLGQKNLSQQEIEKILSKEFPRNASQDFKDAPPLDMKQLNKTIDDLKKSIYLETEYREKIKSISSLKQGRNASGNSMGSRSQHVSRQELFHRQHLLNQTRTANIHRQHSAPGDSKDSQNFGPILHRQLSMGSPPNAHSHHRQQQMSPGAAFGSSPPPAHSSVNRMSSPTGLSSQLSPSTGRPASAGSASLGVRGFQNSLLHSNSSHPNPSGTFSQLCNKIQDEMRSKQQGMKDGKNPPFNVLRPPGSSKQECAKIAQQIAEMNERQRREKLERARIQGQIDGAKAALNSRNIPSRSQISDLLSLTLQGNKPNNNIPNLQLLEGKQGKSYAKRSDIPAIVSSAHQSPGQSSNQLLRKTLTDLASSPSISSVARTYASASKVSNSPRNSMSSNSSSVVVSSSQSPRVSTAMSSKPGSAVVSSSQTPRANTAMSSKPGSAVVSSSQSPRANSASISDKLIKGEESWDDARGIPKQKYYLKTEGMTMKKMYSMVVPRELTNPERKEELMKTVANMMKKIPQTQTTLESQTTKFSSNSVNSQSTVQNTAPSFQNANNGMQTVNSTVGQPQIVSSFNNALMSGSITSVQPTNMDNQTSIMSAMVANNQSCFPESNQNVITSFVDDSFLNLNTLAAASMSVLGNTSSQTQLFSTVHTTQAIQQPTLIGQPMIESQHLYPQVQSIPQITCQPETILATPLYTAPSAVIAEPIFAQQMSSIPTQLELNLQPPIVQQILSVQTQPLDICTTTTFLNVANTPQQSYQFSSVGQMNFSGMSPNIQTLIGQPQLQSPQNHYIAAPELTPAVIQQILSSLKQSGAKKQEQQKQVKQSRPVKPKSQSQKSVNVFMQKSQPANKSKRPNILQAAVKDQVKQMLQGKTDPSVKQSVVEAKRKILELRKQFGHSMDKETINSTVVKDSLPKTVSSVLADKLSPKRTGSLLEKIMAEDDDVEERKISANVPNLPSFFASPEDAVEEELPMNIPDLPDLGAKEFQIDSILALDNDSNLPQDAVVGTGELFTQPTDSTLDQNIPQILSSPADSIPSSCKPQQTSEGNSSLTEVISLSMHKSDLLAPVDIKSISSVALTGSVGDILTKSEIETNPAKVSSTQSTYLNGNRLGKERETRENKIGESDAVEKGKVGPSQETRNIPCNICKVSFHTQELLEQHKKLATCGNKWKCQYCYMLLNSAELLKTHEKNYCLKAPQSMVKCSICGGYFNSHEQLKSHLALLPCKPIGIPANSQLKEETFCGSCKKRFATFNSLKEHMKKCDKQKDNGINKKDKFVTVYKCTICNFMNTNEKIGAKHVDMCRKKNGTAILVEQFRCVLCNDLIADKDSAEKHVLNKCLKESKDKLSSGKQNQKPASSEINKEKSNTNAIKSVEIKIKNETFDNIPSNQSIDMNSLPVEETKINQSPDLKAIGLKRQEEAEELARAKLLKEQRIKAEKKYLAEFNEIERQKREIRMKRQRELEKQKEEMERLEEEKKVEIERQKEMLELERKEKEMRELERKEKQIEEITKQREQFVKFDREKQKIETEKQKCMNSILGNVTLEQKMKEKIKEENMSKIKQEEEQIEFEVGKNLENHKHIEKIRVKMKTPDNNHNKQAKNKNRNKIEYDDFKKEIEPEKKQVSCEKVPNKNISNRYSGRVEGQVLKKRSKSVSPQDIRKLRGLREKRLIKKRKFFDEIESHNADKYQKYVEQIQKKQNNVQVRERQLSGKPDQKETIQEERKIEVKSENRYQRKIKDPKEKFYLDHCRFCPVSNSSDSGKKYNIMLHYINYHKLGFRYISYNYFCNYCSVKFPSTQMMQVQQHVFKTHWKKVLIRVAKGKYNHIAQNSSGGHSTRKDISTLGIKIRSLSELEKTQKHDRAVALRESCAEKLRKIALTRQNSWNESTDMEDDETSSVFFGSNASTDTEASSSTRERRLTDVSAKLASLSKEKDRDELGNQEFISPEGRRKAPRLARQMVRSKKSKHGSVSTNSFETPETNESNDMQSPVRSRSSSVNSSSKSSIITSAKKRKAAIAMSNKITSKARQRSVSGGNCSKMFLTRSGRAVKKPDLDYDHLTESSGITGSSEDNSEFEDSVVRKRKSGQKRSVRERSVDEATTDTEESSFEEAKPRVTRLSLSRNQKDEKSESDNTNQGETEPRSSKRLRTQSDPEKIINKDKEEASVLKKRQVSGRDLALKRVKDMRMRRDERVLTRQSSKNLEESDSETESNFTDTERKMKLITAYKAKLAADRSAESDSGSTSADDESVEREYRLRTRSAKKAYVVESGSSEEDSVKRKWNRKTKDSEDSDFEPEDSEFEPEEMITKRKKSTNKLPSTSSESEKLTQTIDKKKAVTVLVDPKDDDDLNVDYGNLDSAVHSENRTDNEDTDHLKEQTKKPEVKDAMEDVGLDTVFVKSKIISDVKHLGSEKLPAVVMDDEEFALLKSDFVEETKSGRVNTNENKRTALVSRPDKKGFDSEFMRYTTVERDDDEEDSNETKSDQEVEDGVNGNGNIKEEKSDLLVDTSLLNDDVPILPPRNAEEKYIYPKQKKVYVEKVVGNSKSRSRSPRQNQLKEVKVVVEDISLVNKTVKEENTKKKLIEECESSKCTIKVQRLSQEEIEKHLPRLKRLKKTKEDHPTITIDSDEDSEEPVVVKNKKPQVIDKGSKIIEKKSISDKKDKKRKIEEKMNESFTEYETLIQDIVLDGSIIDQLLVGETLEEDLPAPRTHSQINRTDSTESKECVQIVFEEDSGGTPEKVIAVDAKCETSIEESGDDTDANKVIFVNDDIDEKKNETNTKSEKKPNNLPEDKVNTDIEGDICIIEEHPETGLTYDVIINSDSDSNEGNDDVTDGVTVMEVEENNLNANPANRSNISVTESVDVNSKGECSDLDRNRADSSIGTVSESTIKPQEFTEECDESFDNNTNNFTKEQGKEKEPKNSDIEPSDDSKITAVPDDNLSVETHNEIKETSAKVNSNVSSQSTHVGNESRGMEVKENLDNNACEAQQNAIGDPHKELVILSETGLDNASKDRSILKELTSEKETTTEMDVQEEIDYPLSDGDNLNPDNMLKSNQDNVDQLENEEEAMAMSRINETVVENISTCEEDIATAAYEQVCGAETDVAAKEESIQEEITTKKQTKTVEVDFLEQTDPLHSDDDNPNNDTEFMLTSNQENKDEQVLNHEKFMAMNQMNESVMENTETFKIDIATATNQQVIVAEADVDSKEESILEEITTKKETEVISAFQGQTENLHSEGANPNNDTEFMLTSNQENKDEQVLNHEKSMAINQMNETVVENTETFKIDIVTAAIEQVSGAETDIASKEESLLKEMTTEKETEKISAFPEQTENLNSVANNSNNENEFKLTSNNDGQVLNYEKSMAMNRVNDNFVENMETCKIDIATAANKQVDGAEADVASKEEYFLEEISTEKETEAVSSYPEQTHNLLSEGDNLNNDGEFRPTSNQVNTEEHVVNNEEPVKMNMAGETNLENNHMCNQGKQDIDKAVKEEVSYVESGDYKLTDKSEETKTIKDSNVSSASFNKTDNTGEIESGIDDTTDIRTCIQQNFLEQKDQILGENKSADDERNVTFESVIPELSEKPIEMEHVASVERSFNTAQPVNCDVCENDDESRHSESNEKLCEIEHFKIKDHSEKIADSVKHDNLETEDNVGMEVNNDLKAKQFSVASVVTSSLLALQSYSDSENESDVEEFYIEIEYNETIVNEDKNENVQGVKESENMLGEDCGSRQVLSDFGASEMAKKETQDLVECSELSQNYSDVEKNSVTILESSKPDTVSVELHYKDIASEHINEPDVEVRNNGDILIARPLLNLGVLEIKDSPSSHSYTQLNDDFDIEPISITPVVMSDNDNQSNLLSESKQEDLAAEKESANNVVQMAERYEISSDEPTVTSEHESGGFGDSENESDVEDFYIEIQHNETIVNEDKNENVQGVKESENMLGEDCGSRQVLSDLGASEMAKKETQDLVECSELSQNYSDVEKNSVAILESSEPDTVSVELHYKDIASEHINEPDVEVRNNGDILIARPLLNLGVLEIKDSPSSHSYTQLNDDFDIEPISITPVVMSDNDNQSNLLSESKQEDLAAEKESANNVVQMAERYEISSDEPTVTSEHESKGFEIGCEGNIEHFDNISDHQKEETSPCQQLETDTATSTELGTPEDPQDIKSYEFAGHKADNEMSIGLGSRFTEISTETRAHERKASNSSLSELSLLSCPEYESEDSSDGNIWSKNATNNQSEEQRELSPELRKLINGDVTVKVESCEGMDSAQETMIASDLDTTIVASEENENVNRRSISGLDSSIPAYTEVIDFKHEVAVEVEMHQRTLTKVTLEDATRDVLNEENIKIVYHKEVEDFKENRTNVLSGDLNTSDLVEDDRNLEEVQKASSSLKIGNNDTLVTDPELTNTDTNTDIMNIQSVLNIGENLENTCKNKSKEEIENIDSSQSEVATFHQPSSNVKVEVSENMPVADMKICTQNIDETVNQISMTADEKIEKKQQSYAHKQTDFGSEFEEATGSESDKNRTTNADSVPIDDKWEEEVPQQDCVRDTEVTVTAVDSAVTEKDLGTSLEQVVGKSAGNEEVTKTVIVDKNVVTNKKQVLETELNVEEKLQSVPKRTRTRARTTSVETDTKNRPREKRPRLKSADKKMAETKPFGHSTENLDQCGSERPVNLQDTTSQQEDKCSKITQKTSNLKEEKQLISGEKSKCHINKTIDEKGLSSKGEDLKSITDLESRSKASVTEVSGTESVLQNERSTSERMNKTSTSLIESSKESQEMIPSVVQQENESEEDFIRRTETLRSELKKMANKPYESDFNFEDNAKAGKSPSEVAQSSIFWPSESEGKMDNFDTASLYSNSSSGECSNTSGKKDGKSKVLARVQRDFGKEELARKLSAQTTSSVVLSTCSSPQKTTLSTMAVKIVKTMGASVANAGSHQTGFNNPLINTNLINPSPVQYRRRLSGEYTGSIQISNQRVLSKTTSQPTIVQMPVLRTMPNVPPLIKLTKSNVGQTYQVLTSRGAFKKAAEPVKIISVVQRKRHSSEAQLKTADVGVLQQEIPLTNDSTNQSKVTTLKSAELIVPKDTKIEDHTSASTGNINEQPGDGNKSPVIPNKVRSLRAARKECKPFKWESSPSPPKRLRPRSNESADKVITSRKEVSQEKSVTDQNNTSVNRKSRNSKKELQLTKTHDVVTDAEELIAKKPSAVKDLKSSSGKALAITARSCKSPPASKLNTGAEKFPKGSIMADSNKSTTAKAKTRDESILRSPSLEGRRTRSRDNENASTDEGRLRTRSRSGSKDNSKKNDKNKQAQSGKQQSPQKTGLGTSKCQKKVVIQKQSSKTISSETKEVTKTKLENRNSIQDKNKNKLTKLDPALNEMVSEGIVSEHNETNVVQDKTDTTIRKSMKRKSDKLNSESDSTVGEVSDEPSEKVCKLDGTSRSPEKCCANSDCDQCKREADKEEEIQTRPSVRQIFHRGKVIEIQQGRISETEIQNFRTRRLPANTGEASGSKIDKQDKKEIPRRRINSDFAKLRPDEITPIDMKDINKYISATLKDIKKQREGNTNLKWTVQKKGARQHTFPYSFKRTNQNV